MQLLSKSDILNMIRNYDVNVQLNELKKTANYFLTEGVKKRTPWISVPGFGEESKEVQNKFIEELVAGGHEFYQTKDFAKFTTDEWAEIEEYVPTFKLIHQINSKRNYILIRMPFEK